MWLCFWELRLLNCSSSVDASGTDTLFPWGGVEPLKTVGCLFPHKMCIVYLIACLLQIHFFLDFTLNKIMIWNDVPANWITSYGGWNPHKNFMMRLCFGQVNQFKGWGRSMSVSDYFRLTSLRMVLFHWKTLTTCTLGTLASGKGKSP